MNDSAMTMLHGDAGDGGHASPGGSASECLSQAWLAIAQASAAEHARERYDLASLAALRAAAAIVAFHRSSDTAAVRRAETDTVWTLVSRWAPELREWADFFAMVTEVRLRLRRRGPVGITQRLADDMLRDADRFVHEARSVLLRRRTRAATALDHRSDRHGG